jgi:type II secretory ATPase GspE/PulE/Tfp pilus assembly ATPase PilB-like protein
LTVGGPVRELIVSGAPASEILAAARQGGMRTLWENGLDLVFQGRTSIEEVQRVAFMEA